jgi:hypothetical protein
VHPPFVFKRRQKWVTQAFILLKVLEKHDDQLEVIYLAHAEIQALHDFNGFKCISI